MITDVSLGESKLRIRITELYKKCKYNEYFAHSVKNPIPVSLPRNRREGRESG